MMFGRRQLLDTDGRPISDDVITAAHGSVQPSLDVVRRAVEDMVDGICGPNLIGAPEDATSRHTDAIIQDWMSYGSPEPDSLYDIIGRHILEIQSTTRRPEISAANRRWIES